jgi:hypothetical protein
VSPLGVSLSFSAKPCSQPLSTEAILAIVFCNLIFFGAVLFGIVFSFVVFHLRSLIGIYYYLNPDLQEHVFQSSDEKESMILQNKFNPATARDVVCDLRISLYNCCTNFKEFV